MKTAREQASTDGGIEAPSVPQSGDFESAFEIGTTDVAAAMPPKSDKANRKGTVSVKIGDDGNADFSSLKPKQAERWKELVESPEFQERFGLEPRRLEIDPALVESLLDMLGRVQATVFAFKYNIPYKFAFEIAQFSEPEKAQLVPPSKRVIEKHAPALAAKYGDELILFGLLTNITLIKLSACKHLSDELNKKSPQAGEQGAEARPTNGEARKEDLPGSYSPTV